MIYQKVGDLCSFTLHVPGLEIPEDTMLKFLLEKGFEIVYPGEMLEVARFQIGRSKYLKYALVSEAPNVVDCSSLIKWVYARRGIWLPRNLLLWQNLGQKVSLAKAVDGDIIFATDLDGSTVAHVGLATANGTLIHAINRYGVVETLLEVVLKRRHVQMVRRLIPLGVRTVTLKLTENTEVETSDDIEFLVRRLLG